MYLLIFILFIVGFMFLMLFIDFFIVVLYQWICVFYLLCATFVINTGWEMYQMATNLVIQHSIGEE